MKTIKKIKELYGISDHDIAAFFQYKNTHSYITSSAKQRIEKAIVRLEALFTLPDPD